MRTLAPYPYLLTLVSTFIVAVASALHSPAALATPLTTIAVPGRANPWLAGMPDGSVGGKGYDHAPAESPAQVPLPVTGGEIFTFSVGGIVAHGGLDQAGTGPEGFTNAVVSRSTGAENGIADIHAPINALIGIFLNDSVPSLSPPPAALEFLTQAERDFLTLSPGLSQPFYIGDGETSGGIVQEFIAPAGATRLFLGTMDTEHWSDNLGSFTVTTAVPEPSSVVILAGMSLMIFGMLCRRRSTRQ